MCVLNNTNKKKGLSNWEMGEMWKGTEGGYMGGARERNSRGKVM